MDQQFGCYFSYKSFFIDNHSRAYKILCTRCMVAGVRTVTAEARASANRYRGRINFGLSVFILAQPSTESRSLYD